MAEDHREATRRNLVAQAALVWGGIEDLQGFIDTGAVGGKAKGIGRPLAATPEVERYEEAIRRAGRFVMPDEVDQWLNEGDGRPGDGQPVAAA